MEILCVLMGMFTGVVAGGYMFIKPLAERDKTIADKTNECIQLNDEFNSARTELEDTKFDLSVANKEIEQKDEFINKISYEITRNIYNSKETDRVKLNKIKELVDDYQSIN